jgi:threonine/homoserine/homoserine lactone efflux protein
MTIIEMLLIGFSVGLTGAMAPGPMLFATIESSLKTGWSAGPKVVFGHAILEVFTCTLILR